MDFEAGGRIFSIAFHYSWPPGPVAGRSPGANINNYSCKLGARHPRNPKIYVEERLRALGNSSSNHRKVFHAGKSVLRNHRSLEGKAIWLLKGGGGSFLTNNRSRELMSLRYMYNFFWQQNQKTGKVRETFDVQNSVAAGR